MKNLIFNGIHTDLAADFLGRVIQKYPLESLVVTRTEYGVPAPSVNPGCRYTELDHFKCMYGEYPESETAYLDTAILEQLKPYWFNLLEMFDRLSPELVYSYEDRMRMAMAQIRYWNDVIETNKVDLYLGVNYPHETYDYVIYALCKAKGIRTLFFAESKVDGYVQLFENIEEADARVKISTNENHDQEVVLAPLMQKHWESQTKEFKDPFYVAYNQNLLAQEKKLTNVIKKSVSQLKLRILRVLKYRHLSVYRVIKILFYSVLFGKKAEKELHQAYDRLVKPVSLDEKFIFLALHFQPECTTCPLGGYFNYQELMIDLLARSLPEGMYLYVKEHPDQRINGRTPDFYKTISKSPKVKLISKTIKSRELIDRCVAVATVTGTAAWEALFKNKPVILFGSVFFQYAPNVFQVKTLADVQGAVNRIVQGNVIPKTADLMKLYLKQLETHGIRGWVDSYYRVVSEVDHQTNLNNLMNAFEARMKE